MSSVGKQFCAFLRTVRRRMVVARMVERIGISLFICAMASLSLTTIFLFYARSTRGVVEISAAAGAIAGAIWGSTRRPSLLSAALLTDKQWQTDELISSALQYRNSPADPANTWVRSLLAAADATCSQRSPNEISVRKLGGRAWAGIVLAVALAGTLAIFGSKPDVNSAEGLSNRTLASAANPRATGERLIADRFLSPDNRPILMADPEDLNASHFGQNEATAPAAESHAQSTDPSDPDPARGQTNDSPGVGTGAARTDTTPGVPNPIATSVAASDPVADIQPPIGKPTGGTGSAASDAGSGFDATAGGQASAAKTANAGPPPWTTQDWPAEVDRANSAVNAGRIPARYHDLVRDYFTNSN